MVEAKEYKWKILDFKNGYLPYSSLDYSSFKTANLNSSFFLFFQDIIKVHNLHNIFEAFENSFKYVHIPLTTIQLIDTLLLENNIENLKKEFYLLMCVFQDKYVLSHEDLNDLRQPLVQDFQDESKDLKVLLEIIFDTLKNGTKTISSISFKSKNTKSVSNFFIVNDLLNLIIEGYGITLENFEKRKTELLENTNNLKFELRDEYWKYIFAKSLYDYISQGKIESGTSNKHIRFVGHFLHIAQIPVNKTNFEISNSNNLKDLLTLSEIKHLNMFIKRPKSFFIK